MIDHQASPGLPADFLQKCGLVGPSVPGGVRFECSTLTCCHCPTVVPINPKRSRALPYCSKCDAYVCENPSCHTYCTPYTKILDDAEKQGFRDVARSITFSGFALRKDSPHV